jgi:hypothetical protein
MNIIRLVPAAVCLIIGIYCFIWSILGTSSPANLRGAAVFFGILWLLLTWAYLHINRPSEKLRAETF